MNNLKPTFCNFLTEVSGFSYREVWEKNNPGLNKSLEILIVSKKKKNYLLYNFGFQYLHLESYQT